jgi:hypothetical protein
MDPTAARTRGGKPEGNRLAFNPISLSLHTPAPAQRFSRAGASRPEGECETRGPPRNGPRGAAGSAPPERAPWANYSTIGRAQTT